MSEAKQATPHSVLIEQLMDSRVPKTEREHAARREIEMLREALRGPAQQAEKQEPNEDYERGFIDGMQEQMKTSVDRAVNATCKREWVNLTDDEIKEIVGPWGPTPISGFTRKLFDQIEAKLKEKNT